MYSPFKEWVLRWIEPYREERAAYMLEWRVFAQKRNASGKWPPCAIGPMDKVELIDLDETDPDYLRKIITDGELKSSRGKVPR